MRRNKINANTKLTKLISGASHPKMIENSTNGCGIYFGALVYRMIIQTIKKILQIKASLNKIRSLLCLALLPPCAKCKMKAKMSDE
jgi:hypothetical protein